MPDPDEEWYRFTRGPGSPTGDGPRPDRDGRPQKASDNAKSGDRSGAGDRRAAATTAEVSIYRGRGSSSPRGWRSRSTVAPSGGHGPGRQGGGGWGEGLEPCRRRWWRRRCPNLRRYCSQETVAEGQTALAVLVVCRTLPSGSLPSFRYSLARAIRLSRLLSFPGLQWPSGPVRPGLDRQEEEVIVGFSLSSPPLVKAQFPFAPTLILRSLWEKERKAGRRQALYLKTSGAASTTTGEMEVLSSRLPGERMTSAPPRAYVARFPRVL